MRCTLICVYLSRVSCTNGTKKSKNIHINVFSFGFRVCEGFFLWINTFNYCCFQLSESIICLFLYFRSSNTLLQFCTVDRKSRHIKRLHCPLVADCSDGISPSSFLWVRPGRVQRYFLSFCCLLSDWSIWFSSVYGINYLKCIPRNAQLPLNCRPFDSKHKVTSLAFYRCLFNAAVQSLVAAEAMHLLLFMCCSPASLCHLFCLLLLYYSLAQTINRRPHFNVSFEALTCSAVWHPITWHDKAVNLYRPGSGICIRRATLAQHQCCW